MSRVLKVTHIEPQDAYDITVDQDHEYFASTSGTPILSHNCKEFIIYSLLGPVFHDNKVEKKRPRIDYVDSPLTGTMPRTWTYIVKKIETDPARLKCIAKEAIKDVKDGHLVLIPLTRVPVIKALAEAINVLAKKEIAAQFHGKIKKDQRKVVIEKARNYKVKVVVGNTSLLSTGINIPRASMLYQVTPSSNIPKAQQRFARVLTPMDDKPQSVIKYFLDDVDIVRRCMSKEHWQCMVPMFRPMVSEKVQQRLKAYFSKKKNDQGDFYKHSGGVL